MFDKTLFKNPPRKLGICPMGHGIGANYEAILDRYDQCGHAGAVINPPESNGFTSNPDNIAHFAKVIDAFKRRGLDYWIYDEAGYPSGQAGGLSLDGHPEFEAKGFYMHRRIAYEPTHAEYRLDDESDKIIWAAKYPVETPGKHESYVQFDKMIPVPFTADHVSCDIGGDSAEVLYIFCVKPAYEGSHSTHNVCSFRRNLNIMDKAAVRQFIDVAFEPIVKMIPDAYRDAVNVFTDEPGLHVWRARSYEVWPYAIAPWCDGLFERYEADHGESLLPYLPLIFEGGTNAYPYRVRFYETVGGMIADAWSGQLSEWCEAHGGGFSGHYICEEDINNHVVHYGDFIKVLEKVSYPGIDVLCCYPEIYQYTTTKFVQMAVRKKQSNGMMVEICPFANKEEFDKDPLNNMTAVMGLLYLGGVRKTNSYFSLSDNNAMAWFNKYVSRLGLMLDGLHNETSVFVYYGIEDVQAQTQPTYTGMWNGISSRVEETANRLTREICDHQHDFYFADRDDLREALRTLADNGQASISGNDVRIVIVPKMDVIYSETLDILRKLSESGVIVRFVDGLPRFSADEGGDVDTDGFCRDSIDGIVSLLEEIDPTVVKPMNEAVVLCGRFTRGGKAITMIVNKSRIPAEVIYSGADAEVYSPDNGDVYGITDGRITIPAMRAVFAVEKG